MNIIGRAQWGARPAKNRTSVPWTQRRSFVVHYSAGPSTQTVKQIQNYHMDGNGWSDVGYNFLVDVSGRIYEGRGWTIVGAHAPNHNTSGIGVCMIGRDGDSTPAAKKAIRWLYDEANRRAGRTLQRLGHRDVYSTSCPGNELHAWVKAGMPVEKGSTLSAKEVWSYPIRTDDGPGDVWQASTVLGHLEKSQDRIEAKIDGQRAVIDELSKAVGSLAADRGQDVDVEALIARITERLESLSVAIKVEE